MTFETRLSEKLSELGLQFPPAPEPKGVYRPVVISGNLARTSGHLPIKPDGELMVGRVGDELTIEDGYKAAMFAGMGILATIRKELGSLDRLRRLVKVLGVVQCTPDFHQQPAVVNGCSELFAEVFGPDSGIGARTAIGTNSLPLNVPVEIEAIFEIQ